MTMKELERCIEVYGEDIYTFCLWLAKSREHADDLYQDTFLTAIEVIDRIDSEENIKSYLLSISIRLWKNRKRKWAWRNRIAPVVEMDEDFHVALPYEEKDRVLDNEKSAVLKSAIAKLPEKYRVIILLHYMEEVPQERIAAILHVPIGTVKSRLYTARQLLKSELEEYFHE